MKCFSSDIGACDCSGIVHEVALPGIGDRKEDPVWSAGGDAQITHPQFISNGSRPKDNPERDGEHHPDCESQDDSFAAGHKRTLHPSPIEINSVHLLKCAHSAGGT